AAFPLAAQDVAPSSDPEALAQLKVEQLFERLCASCHGQDLGGGLAPSFLDGDWKHGSTDAEIARTILKGNLQLGMTPWEGILSEDQIRALVIYIREKEREALSKGIRYPKPEPGKVTKTERASYKVEVVVDGGLEIPWALAFLPDGRALLTERPGRLRVVEAGGSLNPSPVQDTPPVLHHGQGGLMEVAVHPDYLDNGWVYLGIADGWREEREGKDAQPQTMTAVVRGRIKDHRWVDQEWIWKAERAFYTDAGVHFGIRFVFNGGYLFFPVGERGGWHEAQDLANPKGKIFRLHDDGRIPADNPKFDSPDPLPGIWTYGHRNPQGLARDPRDGALYATEHGPRGGDELNHILPGHNYGWPVITHGMNYDGTPITSKTHQEGMVQPVTYWTPSIAACGLTFYTSDRFPGWKNDLFAGALAKQEIRRLRLTEHQVVEQEIVLKDLGRIRALTEGPDGFLYVVLNGPDSVIRLVPADE
ncbi:MAG TPA: PQQ-dependent sugar dehydrogenase, partial [Verrucomicrobiales bacterium]|nr:PQQ-dependent sugar dehydrogenase [Verrucomicrobiales bacterium]